MKISEYAVESMETAAYPNVGNNIFYPCKGLFGEGGELSEKIKKIERADPSTSTPEYTELIKKELGDILWYCAAVAYELNIKLSDDLGGNEEEPDPTTDNDPSLNVLKLPIFIADICSIALYSKIEELDFSDLDIVECALYNIINILEKMAVIFCSTTINEIARLNIEKLKDRQKRNQIKGFGDSR